MQPPMQPPSLNRMPSYSEYQPMPSNTYHPPSQTFEPEHAPMYDSYANSGYMPKKADYNIPKNDEYNAEKEKQEIMESQYPDYEDIQDGGNQQDDLCDAPPVPAFEDIPQNSNGVRDINAPDYGSSGQNRGYNSDNYGAKFSGSTPLDGSGNVYTNEPINNEK